ncbi:MAG: sigma-70 family RNA polymerase sigma factor [Planctomycetota bacterium]
MTSGDESTAPSSGAAPDAAEIDALLEQHLSGLHAFVRLRAGKAIRAQESLSDIVQSVCRDAIAERGRFHYAGDAKFKGWLYTLALRKLIERARYWRRDKRDIRRVASPQRDASGDVPDPVLQAYASVATPSRVLDAKQQVQVLEAAFDTLSDEQREVLSLARIAGLTFAEIATQTGRSEDACRQLAHRAKIRLSMALERAGY